MLSIIELASVTDDVDAKFANYYYEDMPHYVLSLHEWGWEGEPTHLKGNSGLPPLLKIAPLMFILHICVMHAIFFFIILAVLNIFYFYYVVLTYR